MPNPVPHGSQTSRVILSKVGLAAQGQDQGCSDVLRLGISFDLSCGSGALMSVGKRRGTAEPRWGWSGVAQVIPARLSRADVERIRAVLPQSRRRPIKRLLVELSELGGQYQRFLHQDEFGPSRAERMAALRQLLDHFDGLIPLLNALPAPSRLWLGKQFAVTAPPAILSVLDGDFGAFENDEEALQQLAEAASLYDSLAAELTGAEARAIADVASAAETTALLFLNLDSTTSGALIDEVPVPPLSVAGDDENNFAIVHARLCRLTNRLTRALARLESRGGPEPSISQKWLVSQLCTLYSRETGQPVTNSAVTDYAYTGVPRSQAGQFVLAGVEALQPSKAWMMEPDHRVEKTQRPRFLDKNARARTVYFAMRDYIANQPAGTRRGRRKRM